MTPITLHIGMNKTGTSALQKFLHRNRRSLRRAGLLYPETGLGTRTDGPGLHYQLSRAFLDADGSGPALAAALLAEIDDSGCDRAVLSSEFFVELQDLTPLAKAFEGRDVTVLVYLRRHDHWVSSLFAQAVKSTPFPPWGPTVDDFIAFARIEWSHYFRYSRLLDRWAKAFGQEQVTVRPYRPDPGWSLVSDFLAHLGWDAAAVPGLKGDDAARVNRTPSRRQLAAIDHIQRSAIPDDIKIRIIGRIVGREDPERPRLLMTAVTAQSLIEENAKDYADIARRYLGRDSGVLFDEPAPQPGGPDHVALWPAEGITVISQILSESLGG